MELEDRNPGRSLLIFVLVLLDIFFAVAGYILSHQDAVSSDMGTYAVYLMYNFQDVNELPERYSTLQKYVTEEAWEKLDLDGDFRAINAYYKFQAQTSQVHTLLHDDGIVAYRLVNPYILAQDVWLFTYDIDDGAIDNVHEYKMTSVRRGQEGVW